jgi:hypothetical protein
MDCQIFWEVGALHDETASSICACTDACETVKLNAPRITDRPFIILR